MVLTGWTGMDGCHKVYRLHEFCARVAVGADPKPTTFRREAEQKMSANFLQIGMSCTTYLH